MRCQTLESLDLESNYDQKFNRKCVKVPVSEFLINYSNDYS